MAKLDKLYDPDPDDFNLSMVFGTNKEGEFNDWLMENNSDIRFSDFAASACKLALDRKLITRDIEAVLLLSEDMREHYSLVQTENRCTSETTS